MQGIWTALVTPFQSDGSIDTGAFKKLLASQVQGGITGVIPFGTTGESPTLKHEEKEVLLKLALNELKGTGVKVFAGTGTNSTEQTIELSRWADHLGVDGLILVAPYYNKPSQSGLEAHFRSVADAVKCEVMLYNVPGRTGVTIAPETVATLASHPRIRTIKEATANVSSTSEIFEALRNSGSKIDVLSGDDVAFLPFLSIGAVGVVSVASNLIPKQLVQMHALFKAGKLGEAAKIHQEFYPLFRDLFIESNPVPVKWCMAKTGIGGLSSSKVRMPLGALSKASEDKLRATLKRCGLPCE